MDQHAFETGKTAYQQGDWGSAIAALRSARTDGEPAGELEHLLGNAYMKTGDYSDAARAYAEALKDESYGKAGALHCNRGRALLAAGRLEEAVEDLTQASEDPSYATPYKALLALGDAQAALGDTRSAGVAYRSAAIDEANPDPALALSKLGSCFVELGRPVDAIEAYRTALDFSTPAVNEDAIYAELGSAYVAANRMTEAVDAYKHADDDGFELTAVQRASYEAAQKAVAAITNRTPSETDQLLAAAGYGSPSASGHYDPLDPTGKSGELIPSAEDTGFFTVEESDLVAADTKDARKIERKHKHRGGKIAAVIIIIVVLLLAACGFAYWRGLGWPSQQAVAEQLFADKTSGDVSAVLASSLSDEAKEQISEELPANATISVDGIDQSMSQSTVLVTATLSEGGTQQFSISMLRDGISWKVSAVRIVYASQDGQTPSFAADSTTQSTESSASSTDTSADTSADSADSSATTTNTDAS